jgi:hypothetical protein
LDAGGSYEDDRTDPSGSQGRAIPQVVSARELAFGPGIEGP